jgi:uncharacterized protein (DUF302 family)
MNAIFKASLLVAACLSYTLSMAGSLHTMNPTYTTSVAFLDAEQQLTAAIKKNKMGLVSKASATQGAAAIGITIRGNRVFGVFNPKFAVRMLAASVAAGIEAPIRIYLYENDDGTASITYKKPTDVFKPYGNEALDQMARELDLIFSNIVRDALQPQ